MHRIDPVCLPQTVGIVDCLLQNPFESVDGGVIEEDGDIHSPLYASRAHLATINTSSEIRIRGGRLCGIDRVAAVPLQSGRAAPRADRIRLFETKNHKQREATKKLDNTGFRQGGIETSVTWFAP